jgi:hypothetical protein
MASYVTITLDTTAPGGVVIDLASGADFTAVRDIVAALTTTDGTTTGYTMKLWGDVDTAYDSDVQATEGASNWITYAATKAIRLSTGDGSKTIHLKIRDDVNNASTEATDSITLDTTIPVATIQSGPTPAKISKQTGKRTSTVVWQSDSQYDAYKIKVVPATNSIHTAGTQIPTTGGSTNVSGSTANQPALTNVTSTIDGADLETAGAEGANIVKVFVQDDAGNWSV